MKNLLITGGCGFIGSNYINYIFKKYNDVRIINIDAMYYCASETNIEEDVRNSERYILVKGNLCSYDLVYHIIEHYKIDHIIHFAAQSHVQNSFEDALQYTKDNVVGTHNLLEAVRKYGKIKKFIHVSTDEVYGESMIEQNETKKTEESILCPTNPYAATKASAELIAQSYYYSFNIPIIITRGNNVYGPNQYPEKIIPKFIKLLCEDKNVTIQGDGTNVRAFIHVADVVKAFDIILEKGVIGEIYNIGSDDNEEYTVKYVAEMLIKKIKKTDNCDEYIEYITDRPFNDKRYYISNEKIKKLGWEITKNFEEGIDTLIKMYSAK
jgi:UDP-glucose 4,6-dehydratase